MKRNRAAFGAIFLGVILLAGFPKRLGGQAGNAQSQDSSLLSERDVAARKAALMNDTTDLEAMARSLNGTEFSTALEIDSKGQQGIMELDAALWFLGIYDSMQCEPDREVAKAALKNRLGFYSHMLGLEADQAAGNLALARLPATAQTGARVKDDLRTAKSKLDEIADSLN
jgi:hypothetical protein